jgi:hypothetical protein
MSKGGGGVDIPSNYTIALGSTSTPLQVDVDIDKIAPVTVNSNLAVTQPIVTQSTSTSTANSTANLDLKIEPLDVKVEPLTIDSDSKSLIDLKPVVVDSCQTIRLAPLPPIHVEQPYSQHFGVTFMGMEIFGFNVSGTSEMKLHSPRKHHPCEPHEREHQAAPAENPRATGPQSSRTGGGLRVRVNDNE